MTPPTEGWWLRLSTNALAHPKLRAAGPDGVLLWLAALGWSAHYGTDGHVPAEMLRVLSETAWATEDPHGLAARLVACGLWHDVEGGWLVHGFSEWQEGRDERAESRRLKAERQARWRAKAKRSEDSGEYETSPETST